MAITKICDGLIYDGSLNAPVRGDLWIRDDVILSVGGSAPAAQADTTIDAKGRIVCPGFVDIHRHLDVKPFDPRWTGEAELRQGITTTVVGNCGMSMTPAGESFAAEQYDFTEPILGPMCPRPPRTFPGYLDALSARPLPMNIAAMVGTGTVRASIKGFSDTPFTPEELSKARRTIAEALDAGAPGVSVGIMYLPECYGTLDEFAEMLRPLGKRGSILTAHIRGEGDTLVESVNEIIEIARRAGCALEISHFKAVGPRNWRSRIHEAIKRIDQARSEGLPVSCDFYPYNCGSTALTTMLPPDFVQGDMTGALARLGTKAGVQAYRESIAREYPDWENHATMLGWDRIMISGVFREHNLRFQGLSVAEGAEKSGFEDAPALAAYLMHDEDGKTCIINRSMCQEDIDAIARLPYSAIISDAIYADTQMPHPRMYGAMPRVIREYVLERNVLSMQQAIHKMTALPAGRMGLTGRGVLRAGACADVLMFDPGRFTDRATYSEPTQLAEGLDLMLINGQKVIENDVLLNRTSGKRLRRSYR